MGLYEVLLRLQCERKTAPDPRWHLSIVDAETRAAQAQRIAEGKAAAEALFQERLTAAEPIVAGGRDVRDHVADPHQIPMLRDPSIHAFTVHSDDMVTVMARAVVR